MKTGLLVITAFYLAVTIFVIISHLLRGSSSMNHASIIHAITSQDQGTLNTLLQNKVDIELRDESFRFMTPLMIAAGTGNLEIVKILIDHNANMNTTRHDHTTALFYAIAGKHLETAKWMIENGAYVDQSDKKGNTPLILALLINDESFVRYLIEHKADVNATNGVGPGIDYFSNASDYNRWLTGKKNRDDIISREKTTVGAIYLYIDQVYGQREESEIFWKPPLWYAIEQGNSDLLNLLVNNGADIHWTLKNRFGFGDKYSQGISSLMYASIKGKSDIIKILLDGSVELNARDENERNALYYAINSQSAEAVELLFNAGINQVVVESEYNDGKTAWQIASSTLISDEIKKKLKELGALKQPPKKKKAVKKIREQ